MTTAELLAAVDDFIVNKLARGIADQPPLDNPELSLGIVVTDPTMTYIRYVNITVERLEVASKAFQMQADAEKLKITLT